MRDKLIERICREFPAHFIGTAFFDEMARVYSASRVLFNWSIRNDVNMRVFEALACGSLLVTNDLAKNGQDELFQDGGHLATYREPGRCWRRLGMTCVIARSGRRSGQRGGPRPLLGNTYRHRVKRLLAEAERRLVRSVVDCCSRKRFPSGGASEKIQPEGGTPAGNQESPSWSSAFRRSADSERPLPQSDTRAASMAGLTSSSVPCFNQCEFTRPCLQSLFRYKRSAWDLIVIDNGSIDDTAAYTAGVQDAPSVPITLITNAQKVGFPVAINQGLQEARGV